MYHHAPDPIKGRALRVSIPEKVLKQSCFSFFSWRFDGISVIIVSVSMFPDIKQLSRKQREEWMIMDDQYFSFESLSRIYSVKDLLRL